MTQKELVIERLELLKSRMKEGKIYEADGSLQRFEICGNVLFPYTIE